MNKDLDHFLQLALLRVRHRQKELGAPNINQLETVEEVQYLRLLEELIQEQIPHENPRRSTSTSR